MKLFIKGFCAVAVLIVAFVFYKRMNACDYVKAQVNLGVTSRAFEDGGMIPKKYTGRGNDISPPIKLEAVVDMSSIKRSNSVVYRIIS